MSFYNPYAFVPASRSADPVPPVRGGTLYPDRWTGTLRVRMKAATPLLVTEQREVGDRAHRSTRVVDGKVCVAPASVKGMLRTEYEMLSGSRFGVFEKHDERLGHRIESVRPRAFDLVPVRIVEVNGQKKAQPFTGMGSGALPAAWVKIPQQLAPGAEVHAWVIRMRRRTGNVAFEYWRVVHIEPAGPGTARQVPAYKPGNYESARHQFVARDPLRIEGYYVATGETIDNKHNERVFFNGGSTPDPLPLGEKVLDDWAALVASYKRARPARVAGTKLDISPHIKVSGIEALPAGLFCYAKLDKPGHKVTALYPVAVSRMLYDRAPRELAAAADLLPADTHAEFSAAESLFGWAPPSGREERAGSRPVRGRVRIGPVHSTRLAKNIVAGLDRDLAVLERPRPGQDLFYAARDPEGRPLRSSPGFRKGQGLRGRKVYPHQPRTTWDPNQSPPWLHNGTGQGGGPQNARLEDWVKIGAEFDFDIHVENLDDYELGRLLLILHGRGDGAARFHKFGGGKPLGFGSVTLQVLFEGSDVRDGTRWRSWLAFDPEPAGRLLGEELAAALVEPIRSSRAYDAFLAGFPADHHVHYPNDPNPDDGQLRDENRYAWFVANRKRRDELRPLALGELGADTGLALPEQPIPPRVK